MECCGTFHEKGLQTEQVNFNIYDLLRLSAQYLWRAWHCVGSRKLRSQLAVGIRFIALPKLVGIISPTFRLQSEE